MRDGVVFYKSFRDAIEALPDEYKAETYSAILAYAFDDEEYTGESGIVRAVYTLVKPQIDANNCRYENGRKGGRPPKNEGEEKPNDNQTETKQKPNNNQTETKQKPNNNQTITEPKPKEKEKEKEKVKEKVKDKDKEKESAKALSKEKAAPAASPPTEKHDFGEYGWVKLTESEYDRIVSEHGKAETDRAIAYVDESAQSTGNKNKWRDWNLVVRRAIKHRWGCDFASKNKRNPVDYSQRQYTDESIRAYIYDTLEEMGDYDEDQD